MPQGYRALLLAILLGCAAEEPSFYRGGRSAVAAVAPRDLAAVYRAALGGSFTVADPNLSILVDTLYLPRDPGLAGGAPIGAEERRAIQALDAVKGTCAVPLDARRREALVCQAPRAGYAARFSEPYALGPDSLQVHVVVEQYATPSGPQLERLRFERAYHVVRRAGAWRAVREARLPAP